MAIAEHAAAPAVNPTTGTGAVTPLTTGSFSPPAGSLVIALCALGAGSSAGTITVTDSVGGGGWAKVSKLGPASRYGVAAVAYKYFAAAPGSITVSAAFTGITGGRYLQIKTLTGVSPSTPVGGTVAITPAASTSRTTAITRTVAGSYVAGIGVCNNQPTTASYTAAPATTELGDFWAGATDQCGMSAFKQTALTSAPGPATLGFTTTVGAAAPTVRSSASYASTATETAAIVPLPTGWVAGDVVYIGYELTGSNGTVDTVPGWTPVVAGFRSSGNGSSRTGVLRRVMVAGDTAPEIGFTTTPGRFAAVSVAVQNADTTTPENVTGVSDSNSGVTYPSVRAPSIAASPNTLLLSFHAARNGVGGATTTFAPPAGMTEVAEVATSVVSGASNAAIEVCSLALTAAGTTGTKIATATSSTPPGTDFNPMGAALVVRGGGSADGPMALVEFLPAGEVAASATPDISYQVLIDWNGDDAFTGTGEDVTARTLTRSAVTAAFGRDQSRAGTPVRPGVADFELNNTSRDYSPDNTASPLFGLTGPGRDVWIKATAFGSAYTIYRGALDDYDVQPAIEDRSVRVSCIDALGNLASGNISTGLHRGLRTGEAIGLILDAIGWPQDKRALDVGATLLPFWWEEGAEAGAAVDRVLDCEGLTATVYVDVDGNFCFRDRHSRLVSPSSATVQATFRANSDTDPDPIMSPPFTYNGGWRDIVNSVTYSIDQRAVSGGLVDIWTSDDTYTVPPSESIVLRVEANDPFLGAVVPVAGTDYTLVEGTVTFGLLRTSGQVTEITATADAAGATFTTLRLRAYSVTVTNTTKVTMEDAASITRYGLRSTTLDMPFANAYDAAAVAAVMLGHRAQRLPIVSFRVLSKTPGRIVHQLGRDLLDRIHIIEPETCIDADFWIEQIQHQFTAVFHETTFGCEKIPAIGTGVSDPATIFQFDGGPGHRFNEGVFGW